MTIAIAVKTKYLNPITLPAPWSGVLVPGANVTLAASADAFVAACGGTQAAAAAFYITELGDIDNSHISEGFGQSGLGALKLPVRGAHTAGNIVVASPGATIGGVSPSITDAPDSLRFLLAAQTTTTEKGVWIWNGAAVPMTRATDWDVGLAIKGGTLIVSAAGTNADVLYEVSNDSDVVVGTGTPTFIVAGGAAALTLASLSDAAPAPVGLPAAGVAVTVARADHVHGPVGPAIDFGTGVDGALVLDDVGANSPQGGATWGGGVWTAQRDIHAAAFTLAAATTLNMAGFRLFANGTLTLAATSLIHSNGGAGTAAAGAANGVAGAAAGTGTLLGSVAGKDGRAGAAGVNGIDGEATIASLGGDGGAGGAANAHTGGAAGAATALTASQGALDLAPWVGQHGYLFGVGIPFSTPLGSGASGGSGAGGDDNAGTGGGGGGSGGGGGALLVFARKLVGVASSTIAAAGGAGGAGGDGVGGDADGGGGGGGGGGGYVIAVTADAADWAGALSAAGGVGGAASLPAGGDVAGTIGSNGAAGKTALLALS